MRKKTGGAVLRNRMKRTIKEFFRLHKELFRGGQDSLIKVKKIPPENYMERYERRAAATTTERESSLVKKSLICLVDIYRLLISPFIPTQCRFYPTCSSYMKEAIEKKGVGKGIVLGLKRILKCNPFCSGGYDPVK